MSDDDDRTGEEVRHAHAQEVAQVAVEARREKGSGSGKRLREIERILRRHRVWSGLTPEQATSLLETSAPRS